MYSSGSDVWGQTARFWEDIWCQKRTITNQNLNPFFKSKMSGKISLSPLAKIWTLDFSFSSQSWETAFQISLSFFSKWRNYFHFLFLLLKLGNKMTISLSLFESWEFFLDFSFFPQNWERDLRFLVLLLQLENDIFKISRSLLIQVFGFSSMTAE